jgi:hypothetical protein
MMNGTNNLRLVSRKLPYYLKSHEILIDIGLCQHVKHGWVVQGNASEMNTRLH